MARNADSYQVQDSVSEIKAKLQVCVENSAANETDLSYVSARALIDICEVLDSLINKVIDREEYEQEMKERD